MVYELTYKLRLFSVGNVIHDCWRGTAPTRTQLDSDIDLLQLMAAILYVSTGKIRGYSGVLATQYEN